MNIFRNLIGKVWQDPNAAEVVKIQSGQLYYNRPGSIRTPNECIYQDAMATIRRVPNMEHNFQLVITRVLEEGSEELLAEEDETDEEKVFLISEELEFRPEATEDGPSFVWRDPQGGTDETFKFVALDANAPTLVFFETCMYRAMFERKYRSSGTVSEAELEQFIWKPPVKQSAVKSSGRRTSSTKESTPSAPVAAPASNQPSISPKLKSPESYGETLLSGKALLYIWQLENPDHPDGCFELKEDDPVTAYIIERSTFDYVLVIAINKQTILVHAFSDSMNPRWAPQHRSLTWNHENAEERKTDSWLLSFDDASTYEEFRKQFTICEWEARNDMDWSKAKPVDQDYVMRAVNEDVEMADPEDDEEEEDLVADVLDPESDGSESEEEEEEEEEDDVVPALNKGDRNEHLTVGYKGDRSYVVRGNNIGVFHRSGDHEIKYYGTINNVATPGGKIFKPKDVMLHDQDTKMILMNPTAPNSLFSMDIERGKVVEEWKVHDDISVNHIAPDNKFAQMTPEQTVVGVSHNSLFRIDPRMSGNKMVDSQFKQYVSKNQFSGVATTASGRLAVASEKGDIRLFDAIGKNAKTALPPLGDPIIGVDVTADGRWIVATTKTYLLLIDTLIGEGRYAGQLGFDRSFPATAKPVPRRLQLRGEHVAYMNHDINFSPAKFNQGENAVENAIVTSTGQFVIAWDFAKVKKGQLDKYDIKKYEDLVVQDNFRFGDDKEIIVALQNNVLSINKKQLKRPTRASLAPPNAYSRSGIVNAPY